MTYTIGYTGAETDALLDEVNAASATPGASIIPKSDASSTLFDWVEEYFAAATRETGGTAYQSILGCPCTPSLDLRFWDWKDLTNGYDSMATFTRATVATYRNHLGLIAEASAGELRHDFDPDTGEYLGILIEEARTNLCLQSENLSTTWSTANSSISTDDETAPDGTATADKIVENDTADSTHYVRQNITVTADTVYCFSAFCKADERTKVRLIYRDASTLTDFIYIRADLSAGTFITGSDGNGALTNGGIEPYPGGWYHVWVSGKFNTTDTDGRVGIWLLDAAGEFTYTGDGSSGLHAWGAQLEEGAFPSSYVATTTASVTRNSDQLSMTGTDFSDWYNDDEGTVFTEFQAWAGTNQQIATFSDGTGDERIVIVYTTSEGTGAGYLFVMAGGTGQAGSLPSLITPVTGTVYKHAGAYKVNDFAGVRDGGTVATDTSGSLPVVDRLWIGAGSVGGTLLNGTIRQLTYFPRRLSDALLQTLTT